MCNVQFNMQGLIGTRSSWLNWALRDDFKLCTWSEKDNNMVGTRWYWVSKRQFRLTLALGHYRPIFLNELKVEIWSGVTEFLQTGSQ